MDPTQKPWQPRVDRDRELNPSVRTTEPAGGEDDRTLAEIELETDESEANEDEAEPIKIHK